MLEPAMFPAGSNWLLIETQSEDRAPDIVFEGAWVVGEGAPNAIDEQARGLCFVMAHGGANGTAAALNGVAQTPQTGLTLSTNGQTHRYQFNITQAQGSLQFSMGGQDVSSDQQSLFLVGFNLVTDSRPEDRLEWVLSHDVPFTWRILDHGAMDCSTGEDDYHGASSVQVGPGSSSFTRMEHATRRVGLLGGGYTYLAMEGNIALEAEFSTDGLRSWSSEPGQTVVQHAFWPNGDTATIDVRRLEHLGWTPTVGTMVIGGLNPAALAQLRSDWQEMQTLAVG